MFTGFRSGEILHPTDLTARKHNRQIHQHILDWFSPSPNGFNQHIVLIFSTRRCSVRFLPEQFFFFYFRVLRTMTRIQAGHWGPFFFLVGKSLHRILTITLSVQRGTIWVQSSPSGRGMILSKERGQNWDSSKMKTTSQWEKFDSKWFLSPGKMTKAKVQTPDHHKNKPLGWAPSSIMCLQWRRPGF